jgi:hypothetical protein
VGLPVVFYVDTHVWRLSGPPVIMKPISDPRHADMGRIGGTATSVGKVRRSDNPRTDMFAVAFR